VPTYLFSPPTRSDLPRNTVASDRVTRRLFRHFAPAPRGVNVFIVDGEAVERQPWNDAGVTSTFLGGHVPYEVTAAEKTTLEAAGYTVEEV
jgi:hypothetical protein